MDPQRPRTPERVPVSVPEQPPRPEAGLERPISDRVERGVETVVPTTERSGAASTAPSITAPVAPATDPELRRIEEVLSDGLDDVYKTLPPSIKPAFKKKGEEVARTIQEWTRGAKLAAHKVLRLIREWLGMIPRVNPYYIEQQSKIKTDQMMHLAESGDDVLS